METSPLLSCLGVVVVVVTVVVLPKPLPARDRSWLRNIGCWWWCSLLEGDVVLRAICEAALVGAGGIPTVLMGAAREPGRCSWGTRVNNAESARAPRAREPGRFTRPPPAASSWPPVAMEAGLDVGGAARWPSL